MSTLTSPANDSHEPEPTARRATRYIEPGLLVLLALTLNLLGNDRTSLWDRDEPRYSTCVREMRARGDWIHPTFNGEPRYQKPVLIYWLMRGSVALVGDNTFGMRLVSGLAGAATCLLVWHFGRRLIGHRAGSLAAFMLATAPIMVAESKLATTDATLTLWLVAAQFCLWELSRRESRWLAAGFWVLMALATLTKGPVGLGLIAVSGLVSWRAGGPTSCWRRLHWGSGLLIYALLVAPWLIAVGIVSHGDFFRVAVGEQMVNRVTTGLEKHGGFPGYYLVTILGTFHPWSALVPAAVLAAWTRRRSSPELGFLFGWIVGPLILLECVKTKLVHYYLPAIPACSMLVGWMVVSVVKEQVNLRRCHLGRLAVALLGGTSLVLVVAMATMALMRDSLLRWPLLFVAAILATGTIYALRRIHGGATERAMHALIVTWACVMAGLGGWLLPSAEPYRAPRFVAARLKELSKELDAQPVLHSFQEPSLIYAYGKPLPTIRKWHQLYDLILERGAVVTALLPQELKEFHQKSYLEVELKDKMTWTNLNTGSEEVLQFVLVRVNRSAEGPPRQQTRVK
ncbi:ArnT family glycosyltransferase [Singulisphaera sp. PoT]|uniref:ArnT family glycosyltransferase n=1 Tax=Singulisphaera sp. PoT TaxID=3411797 RepID=UPI003BF5931E